MTSKPSNQLAHDYLVASGYIYEYMCTFEDDGDGESGPHLTGGEWDEYRSDVDRITIDHYDGSAHYDIFAIGDK